MLASKFIFPFLLPPRGQFVIKQFKTNVTCKITTVIKIKRLVYIAVEFFGWKSRYVPLLRSGAFYTLYLNRFQIQKANFKKHLVDDSLLFRCDVREMSDSEDEYKEKQLRIAFLGDSNTGKVSNDIIYTYQMRNNCFRRVSFEDSAKTNSIGSTIQPSGQTFILNISCLPPSIEELSP